MQVPVLELMTLTHHFCNLLRSSVEDLYLTESQKPQQPGATMNFTSLRFEQKMNVELLVVEACSIATYISLLPFLEV